MDLPSKSSSYRGQESKTRNFLQKQSSDSSINLDSKYPKKNPFRSKSDINTSYLSKTDKLHVELFRKEKELENIYNEEKGQIEGKYQNIARGLSEKITAGEVGQEITKKYSESLARNFASEIDKLDKSIRREREALLAEYTNKISMSDTFRGQLELSWQATLKRIKEMKS